MGAVEVCRAIATAQIERIVAVVEQAQPALLVQCVRLGVGGADLEAVAHALVYVYLQRVVVVDAGGLVSDGFGRIADVGNAEIDVAAFIVGLVDQCRRPAGRSRRCSRSCTSADKGRQQAQGSTGKR